LLLLPALAATLACASAGPKPAPAPTTKPKAARTAPGPQARPASRPAPGQRTVADVLATLGPAAERRLRAKFTAAGVRYPPRRVALLAFKEEGRLELWAETTGRPRRVATYPVLGRSGTVGPKLREGDEQIPEGIYRVSWLHPNSQYHLSMKLDYPNAFDRTKAVQEGRTRPGSDIFIHGKDVSEGCLAVGDRAIEELFVLVARVGHDAVRVLIAPNDLRRGGPTEALKVRPEWLPELYATLSAELKRFPRPLPSRR
jgi:hypothetical protein